MPPATVESAAEKIATLAYPIGVEDSASMTFPLTVKFFAAGLEELTGDFSGIEGKGDGVCPFAAKKVMKTNIGKINFRMCQLLLFVDFDTIEV